jgi:hypothetical protein
MAAEQSSSEVSTEFIRLEVQIATILFAIAGFFWSAFGREGSLNFFWVKVAFVLGVFSLILSLLMGLLHLKRVERFWDEMLNQRVSRIDEWRKVVTHEITFKEAEAFHKGTMLNRGLTISAPSWIWILQSIFLGVGIFILFFLFVASLFFQPEVTIIPSLSPVVSTSTPAT